MTTLNNNKTTFDIGIVYDSGNLPHQKGCNSICHVSEIDDNKQTNAKWKQVKIDRAYWIGIRYT